MPAVIVFKTKACSEKLKGETIATSWFDFTTPCSRTRDVLYAHMYIQIKGIMELLTQVKAYLPMFEYKQFKYKLQQKRVIAIQLTIHLPLVG